MKSEVSAIFFEKSENSVLEAKSIFFYSTLLSCPKASIIENQGQGWFRARVSVMDRFRVRGWVRVSFRVREDQGKGQEYVCLQPFLDLEANICLPAASTFFLNRNCFFFVIGIVVARSLSDIESMAGTCEDGWVCNINQEDTKF